jgi:L-asparaginase
MTIKIFITGGTFDKEYDERTGNLFFKKTHVSEMLRRGRCNIPVDIETLMMKDSLEMTDEDRVMINSRCLEVEESHIVITHGTDTMEVTAKYLSKQEIGKTIVLTGAMIPYTFGSSDGFYNLGSALAFVQTLPPGVYVAMNGKYFHAENVRKNKEKGIFEPVRQGSTSGINHHC